jgi:DUF1009 family protein
MGQQAINNKICVIAGNGELPLLACKKAKEQGYELYSVCFDKKNFLPIQMICKAAVYYGPGEVEKILKFLQQKQINQVMFIGKVPKSLYFKIHKIDARAVKVLKQMKRLNDDAIMLAAIHELEKENITVLEQTIFIKDYFAKKGIIAGEAPTQEQQIDIDYGFDIAKQMGKIDIGQTVVVHDKMILAVEAIEGTDAAIKRGCKFGKRKATVVKVSKPSQDQRFDIPVIGEKTLTAMRKYGGKVLAIEADETLIINEQKVKLLAERYNITVIAI